jgi:hypothetical protein
LTTRLILILGNQWPFSFLSPLGVTPSQRLEHNFPSLHFDAVRTAASRDPNGSDVLVLALFTNGHPFAPAEFQRIGSVRFKYSATMAPSTGNSRRTRRHTQKQRKYSKKGMGEVQHSGRESYAQDSSGVEIIKLML